MVRSQVLYPAELRAHLFLRADDLTLIVYLHLRKSLAKFCHLLFIDGYQLT
jgi:hypothetical protein